MEKRPESINKILELRANLLADCPNIKCLVITALENDSDQSMVVYHGEQLDYTALAITTAKILRERVLDRIGRNDVYVHQSQQTLGVNTGTEQGNNQDSSGQDQNSV